jgi:hypothetical protein
MVSGVAAVTGHNGIVGILGRVLHRNGYTGLAEAAEEHGAAAQTPKDRRPNVPMTAELIEFIAQQPGLKGNGRAPLIAALHAERVRQLKEEPLLFTSGAGINAIPTDGAHRRAADEFATPVASRPPSEAVRMAAQAPVPQKDLY